MELVLPETAETLLTYEHYNWNGYAAVTRNRFGTGTAYYIGCMMDDRLLEKILLKALDDAGIDNAERVYFPLIVRKGTNDFGKNVWYYLNYSNQERKLKNMYGDGIELLKGTLVKQGESIRIPPWDVKVVESL